jgi:ABC-type lipoprotein export system ATPase subunit
MNDSLITVQDVTKRFDQGRICALVGMSMHVDVGEWVAVVGPSGCGKSTMLHLIAALDHPDSGHIHVVGNDLDRLADAAAYRRSVMGLVFQFHNLLPSLSAQENIEIPMFGTHRRGRARRARATELLDEVGLSRRAQNRPNELSGGERQRVAIARALANDPPLLLADEPTGSLDSKAGADVLRLLERIRAQRDLTVVMVIYDMTVVGHATRTIHMLDGAVAPEAEATVRRATGQAALAR